MPGSTQSAAPARYGEREGAAMPGEAQLADDLRRMAACNALEVDHSRFFGEGRELQGSASFLGVARRVPTAASQTAR